MQSAVFEKLNSDERFLESFKRSMGYVKLLAELDLLKTGTDGASGKSDEEEEEDSIYDNLSLNSLEGSRSSLAGGAAGEGDDPNAVEAAETTADGDTTLTEDNKGLLAVKKHRRIGSDSLHAFRRGHRRNASHGSLGGTGDGHHSLTQAPLPPILSAEVNGCRTVRESTVGPAVGGKSYAVYRVLVRSRDARGQGEEERAVFRRYSDFYALYERVNAAFPTLARLQFPEKKAFRNMSTQVLQKRQTMLHAYLQVRENVSSFFKN